MFGAREVYQWNDTKLVARERRKKNTNARTGDATELENILLNQFFLSCLFIYKSIYINDVCVFAGTRNACFFDHFNGNNWEEEEDI